MSNNGGDKNQDNKVVCVRFPKEQVEDIESTAEAENISKSELIRQAVADHIGYDTLNNRVNDLETDVNDLETAVKHLLEQHTPNNQTRYINSIEYKLLEDITNGEPNE